MHEKNREHSNRDSPMLLLGRCANFICVTTALRLPNAVHKMLNQLKPYANVAETNERKKKNEKNLHSYPHLHVLHWRLQEPNDG